MEHLLCISKKSCIAIVIRRIQNDIDLIGVRIILIVIVVTIFVSNALISKFRFSPAKLTVDINICGGHEHMHDVVIYAFTKSIENLRFHLKLHDPLCHIVIFAITLQITHIFTDHLYDLFQHIICGILIFSRLSEQSRQAIQRIQIVADSYISYIVRQKSGIIDSFYHSLSV